MYQHVQPGFLWSDVDLEARTLTVREPKNEDDRVIPLSIKAYEILAQRRREWESERRRILVVKPRGYGKANSRRGKLPKGSLCEGRLRS